MTYSEIITSINFAITATRETKRGRLSERERHCVVLNEAVAFMMRCQERKAEIDTLMRRQDA